MGMVSSQNIRHVCPPPQPRQTMGLPMDPNLSEIHVPSGPTSVQQGQSFEGLTLQQLILRKDDLEVELKALGAVLDSHGFTMQTSLTTFDGFPRSDIDVAQARVTRARIISLRNDWKDLMDRIEKGLTPTRTAPLHGLSAYTFRPRDSLC